MREIAGIFIWKGESRSSSQKAKKYKWERTSSLWGNVHLVVFNIVKSNFKFTGSDIFMDAGSQL